MLFPPNSQNGTLCSVSTLWNPWKPNVAILLGFMRVFHMSFYAIPLSLGSTDFKSGFFEVRIVNMILLNIEEIFCLGNISQIIISVVGKYTIVSYIR